MTPTQQKIEEAVEEIVKLAGEGYFEGPDDLESAVRQALTTIAQTAVNDFCEKQALVVSKFECEEHPKAEAVPECAKCQFEQGRQEGEDEALEKAGMSLLEMFKALRVLTPREKIVLGSRFGLADGETHDLEYVCEEFEVTRERIRQIEAKAFDKILQHYSVQFQRTKEAEEAQYKQSQE